MKNSEVWIDFLAGENPLPVKAAGFGAVELATAWCEGIRGQRINDPAEFAIVAEQ